MATPRRKPPKVDTTGEVRENVFRGQVNSALQRLDGADATLDERVTALEDAPPPTTYSDEQARDAIGAALTGGTGITVTPNDGADTITIATTITQYTNEMAMDAIAAMLAAGHGLDVTYNDGADTYTIDVDETELTLTANNVIVANGVTIIARSATPQTVTESGQPNFTDLLGLTITGGLVTAGRSIRVRMGGLYTNNSGSARTPTIRITLGGTSLYEDGWISSNASASATVWELDFCIAAESVTLVHLTGKIFQSGVTTPTTGLGALDASMRMNGMLSAAAGGVTVSSLASNRALTVDFEHPSNTATQTLVRTHYTVELMP